MSIYTVPTGTEIEATAQRTDILHFMDVSGVKMGTTTIPEGTYCQMGAGWMTMTESPSAQTKERKYINEKSKRKNITSYAPSFAYEVLLMFNNPAVKEIYDIYTQRKTGTDAVAPIITVDKFAEKNGNFYPARKGRYAVEVSSCDDDDDMIIKGNFNGQGDEEMGYFDIENGTWSATGTAQSEESQT